MAKASATQWDIYRIKGASQAYLGSVEASDEQEAVEKAAKQFNVSAALKNRLVARKAR